MARTSGTVVMAAPPVGPRWMETTVPCTADSISGRGYEGAGRVCGRTWRKGRLITNNHIVTVESIQIRLDREQLRELRDLEKEFKRSRSEVTRRALAEGIKVMKMELALERYAREEVTLVRAAQFAGVSISQMADAAAGRGVPYFRYPAPELERDAGKLRGRLK